MITDASRLTVNNRPDVRRRHRTGKAQPEAACDGTDRRRTFRATDEAAERMKRKGSQALRGWGEGDAGTWPHRRKMASNPSIG
jgi:hypothetical protein